MVRLGIDGRGSLAPAFHVKRGRRCGRSGGGEAQAGVVLSGLCSAEVPVGSWVIPDQPQHCQFPECAAMPRGWMASRGGPGGVTGLWAGLNAPFSFGRHVRCPGDVSRETILQPRPAGPVRDDTRTSIPAAIPLPIPVARHVCSWRYRSRSGEDMGLRCSGSIPESERHQSRDSSGAGIRTRPGSPSAIGGGGSGFT